MEEQNTLNFSNLVDIFKEGDFPKDADGFTDVPAQAIYQALHELFPNGYREKSREGFYPDGRPYVSYTIAVADPSGGPFFAEVCGYAEARPGQEMSFAGLLTMARRQALLRGLHMGHSMYAKKVTEETASRPLSSPPAAASKPAASGGSTFSGRGYSPSSGGGRGSYSGGGARKPFADDGSDWTGQAKIKKAGSPYEGKAWSELPIEVVQKWASGPNPFKLAQWELARRDREATAADAAVAEAMESRIDAAVEEARGDVPASVAQTMGTSSFSFRR
jgi:hypothetical protein